ncbi:MAG: hypothetical protein PW788_01440 [Micavibrio sp.]|nr:hypothetical protein [Micavibrio sp.]
MQKPCCAAKPETATPQNSNRLNVIQPRVAVAGANPAQETFADKVRQYKPLIVILAVALVAAAGLAAGGHLAFMQAAMGMFLCLLATLKFFSLQGFANTFAGYDLLAARVKAYAFAYPFIEMALGFLYLSGIAPLATNAVMAVLMLVGSLGVAQVIRHGKKVQCACVGSSFALPVGRVTLAENLVMAAMAGMALLHMHGMAW